MRTNSICLFTIRTCWTMARRGQHLYALPADFTPMMLYYNKRLFDQAQAFRILTTAGRGTSSVRPAKRLPFALPARCIPRSTAFRWKTGCPAGYPGYGRTAAMSLPPTAGGRRALSTVPPRHRPCLLCGFGARRPGSVPVAIAGAGREPVSVGTGRYGNQRTLEPGGTEGQRNSETGRCRRGGPAPE